MKLHPSLIGVLMCFTLICHPISAQLTLEHISITQNTGLPDFERKPLKLQRMSMVVAPVLRIANLPSMTEDWIVIDIGDVVVAPYRPRISLRKPLVMGPQSAILMEPGENTPYLRITNFGATGTDGVKMTYENDFPATFVFDVTYDIIHSKEIIHHGDPDFDLLVTRTFDKSTPKLLEKISSGNTGINSFFDIEYDIGPLKEIRRGGTLDSNVTVTRTYDKATPKLEEKITSNNSGVENFFLTSYSLPTLTATSKAGSLVEDVTITRVYDKSTPKLLEKISTGKVNRFFDIVYDMDMLKETRRGGTVDSSIIVTRTYDKATPKLEEKISSDNSSVENFFITSYSLPTLTATSKGGSLVEDVTITRVYDKSTPKLLEKISTGKVNRFFDIVYDMDMLKETRRGGTVDSSIIVTRTYDKATPKLEEKVSSDNPGMDSFFDITYRIDDLSMTHYGGDAGAGVIYRHVYQHNQNSLKQMISSTGSQGSFDVTWNMSAPLRPVGSVTVIGGVGLAPLKVETEFDCAPRIFRETYIDQFAGGLSHTLEHRMLPDPMTGSSMLVYTGGGFEVPFIRIQGPGVPMSLHCNGSAEIDGNLTVTGNLDVLGGMKMFRIHHPLDPENKYLVHFCIESPDVMNIYNGIVTTDDRGYAYVMLPEYFEALNTDFKYQLTCIGQFAQAIVSEKVSENRFVIQTDKPGVEVSWQVTGVRHDPAALKNKRPVEEWKESDVAHH